MPRTLKRVENAAGVDEAGCGPLAGPVVVAAVILPKGARLKGLRDSKQLSQAEREDFDARIREIAEFAIVEISPKEIDRLNILNARLTGMRYAVEQLPRAPEMVFIDGNRMPPGLMIPAETVVKGDDHYLCIAAASVLAKVRRDAIMVELDAAYPGYGFADHKGYPCPSHLEALRRLGPCEVHRRSYKPVQETEQPCLIGVD